MFSKYYVSQVDEQDCGPAALSMILKSYGSEVPIAKIRDIARTDINGTTGLGMAKAAKKLGFQVKAVKGTLELLNRQDIPMPYIIHVKKYGSLQHYYVVFKVKNGKFLVGDPDISSGLHWIDKDRLANEWTGTAFFMLPDVGFKKNKKRSNSMWRILTALKKQRLLIFGIIASSLLVTVINIAGAYFFQFLINTVIPQKSLTLLNISAVTLMSAYILQQLISYLEQLWLNILNRNLSYTLIFDYVKHVVHLPMYFFGTRTSGDIISRFGDTSKIVDAIASSVISLLLNSMVGLVMAFVLGIQNIKLLMLTMMAIPIYMLVVLLFSKRIEQLNRLEMQSNAEVSSKIIESIDGIESIKTQNAENEQLNKINAGLIKFLDYSFKLGNVTQLQQILKNLVRLVFTVLILGFGAKYVIQGEYSIGQLITFNALLGYFLNPIQDIINLQSKYQSARVANNRLTEVYEVPSEPDHVASIPFSLSEINFKNTFFHYGFSKDILKGITFKIKSGEKIALTGPSGSGKSTLVRLLVGFMEPTKGTIEINNFDISNYRLSDLRQTIAYVTQDPHLFSGTVFENLTLGVKTVPSLTEVRKFCQKLQIDKDIMELPNGYDTDLSVSQTQLSGGQKQRICLARGVITGKKVIIFDESTSNLDTQTERKIIDFLNDLKDRTIIFVAHRPEVSQRTKRVIVMNNGKIVEDGSPSRLMQLGGTYASLIQNCAS
ncbi:peptide cleavage/export ABC transporter [Furfurilactobacillus entadae]|uniref:peptide cleavage/export ABC transporter n=1 Tax=Furfurilactobacillus entadae TaxID=2922307 RepID=UPI0035E7A9BE